MIIQLEIEQFIKDIESKIDRLPEDQKSKAIDKINLLTRIKMELRQQQEELTISYNAVQYQEIELMKLKQSIGPLLKENKEYKEQLINEF